MIDDGKLFRQVGNVAGIFISYTLLWKSLEVYNIKSSMNVVCFHFIQSFFNLLIQFFHKHVLYSHCKIDSHLHYSSGYCE